MEKETAMFVLKGRLRISLIIITCLLVAVGATYYLVSQQKNYAYQNTDDVKDTENVMREYLRAREGEGQEDSTKWSLLRYRLLSKRVKKELKESGVGEKEFPDHVSDEAMLTKCRIDRIEKQDKHRMKAIVRCKVVTEHPEGGIVSESRLDFFLIEEGGKWWVNEMMEEGKSYLP